MGLKNKLHNFKEKNKNKKWIPAFSAIHTFLYLPNETTHNGTHIKVADDLKRTMNTVILALVPCLIFGMFNAGYQHNLAVGEIQAAASGFFSSEFWSMANFTIGFWKILPLILVSYGVGLGIEFIFEPPTANMSKLTRPHLQSMAVNAKESAAGMDQWAPGDFRLLSDLAFEHLADILNLIEEEGKFCFVFYLYIRYL